MYLTNHYVFLELIAIGVLQQIRLFVAWLDIVAGQVGLIVKSCSQDFAVFVLISCVLNVITVGLFYFASKKLCKCTAMPSSCRYIFRHLNSIHSKKASH